MSLKAKASGGGLSATKTRKIKRKLELLHKSRKGLLNELDIEDSDVSSDEEDLEDVGGN